MLVRDIMITNVVTISPLASVREAMSVMRQHGIKSLVVEKNGLHDAYGILTYSNILKTIIAEEGDIDLLNVYDICTKPALIISRELDVKHAARMMVQMGLQRLLVTSNNALVGIVNKNDLVSAILAQVDGGA